jgi:phenylalanyl-tRNA synthetase beta chain
MGGAATEVGEGTASILLEAATFDAPTIRHTSTRLNLRSEASSRFERSLSAELPMHAARRATQLFVEICGGTARQGAVDVYPRPHQSPEVAVARARLDTVIGFAVPDGDVERGLEALGFEVEAGDGGWTVRPPWWRTDVSIADDVAEEVVRIAGYDLLPATTLGGRIPTPQPRQLADARETLRDALVEAGLHEVLTYSLTSDEALRRVMAPEDLALIAPLRVANPQSVEREVLRPSLRQAMLEVVDRNIRAGAEEIAIFEISRVYLPADGDALPGEALPGEALPEERQHLVGAVCGVAQDRWGQPSDRGLDFFDAKGALEQAFARLDVSVGFAADVEFGMLPGRVARLSVDGEAVGVLGEMHPSTLTEFEIDRPVALFELDLDRLLPHVPPRRETAPVPRFPAVEQDLALVVDDAVSAGALRELIEQSRLVAAARVFDVYRGDQLPDGKKSVAFAIDYQAADRTLTSDDANNEQARILKRLTREFGAEQRA